MNELIQYQNYLRPTQDLPSHISFDQFKLIKTKIQDYYNNVSMPNKRNTFLKHRDSILMDFMFASGGRITDILNVTTSDIDFTNKILHLKIKKTKIDIKINLDSELCYEIMSFINTYNIQDRLFNITRQAGWYICKKFGKLIELDLHPHMFRHGLALHLMNNMVPIPVISYRLGHKDTKTTMQMYLKVTPHIEKQILEACNIEWR